MFVNSEDIQMKRLFENEPFEIRIRFRDFCVYISCFFAS